MRKMILISCLLVITSNPIFGTSMDVAAGDGMLNAVIGADTTAGGLQAHDEYRLVTTDATYKNSFIY